MIFIVLGILMIFASYKSHEWTEKSNMEIYGRRKLSWDHWDDYNDMGLLSGGLLFTIIGINEMLKPFLSQSLSHVIVGILSIVAGLVIKKSSSYIFKDNFDIILWKLAEYVAYIVALFNFLDVIFWD